MHELNWTAPALSDLREIGRWLDEKASPAIAVRLLSTLRARADFLRDFPAGGRPMLERDFRVLRVYDTPYLIVYRLRGDEIDILRIRHERENWRGDS